MCDGCAQTTEQPKAPERGLLDRLCAIGKPIQETRFKAYCLTIVPRAGTPLTKRPVETPEFGLPSTLPS